MGHKVSPLAFRIGYIKTWKTSGFFDKKEYGSNVSTDLNIRFFVQSFLKGLPIANIFISHTSTGISIVIYTSRTALVLGEGDENAAKLQLAIQKKFGKLCTIEAREVKKPELSADLVADSIARQIEKKMPYRRVIKNAIARSLEKGALGIKVILSGRINGAEIARRETYKEGNIPTQTIRADIDYATERSETVAGTIGVKVWVYKGEVFTK